MPVVLATGDTEEFHAPGPADFELPPAFEILGFGVTKPMLIVVIGTLLIGATLYIAARRAAVVPGKG